MSRSNYRNVDIDDKWGIDASNVIKFRKKIARKIEAKRDQQVPEITDEIVESGGSRAVLVKSIFYALQNGAVNTVLLDSEPSSMLSFNESSVLFLSCAGLSSAEIAHYLGDKDEETVNTFRKRACKKLGVSKKYTMIAKGLKEMIRMQENV